MRPIKDPVSKFIKMRCPKCKNEQITFGKVATSVACLVCGKKIAEPTGGKSKVKARILEILE
ncbi:30S ribosomal protein S27e [Candidatus Woesearchaeota archaeon]|nr:30S ribosomal protein S27e [Candidatus Woesearchaeota archaeon]